MPRRITIDWRMVAGFSGLLFLMTAIGLIGIQRIQGLSGIVAQLAKTDMPLEEAVLQMKSSNSQYGMGIRSYMFWHSTSYLDAAAQAAKFDKVYAALKDFDKHLSFYETQALDEKQKKWIKAARANHEEIRRLGDKIISLTDKSQGGMRPDEELNRNLIDFENKLFRLDSFLDDPLQRFNLAAIDDRLAIAEADRKRSISFLWWSLGIGLFLGGQTALLVYRRSKQEKERREFLWQKIIGVEEEQRNNLSFQIHDQMGQDLSALKIYLGLIENDVPQDAKDQKEKVEKSKKILSGLMAKTHNISELLRPPELDDLGLSESIAALVLHHKEMTGLTYVYLKPSGELKLSSDLSLILYRVVQEALTNILKHSQAKNVEVSLEKRSDKVYLAVKDDGIGFDYGAYLERPLRRREDKVKMGLHGIRERIELLGGKFSVDTKSGEGTRVEVVL